MSYGELSFEIVWWACLILGDRYFATLSLSDLGLIFPLLRATGESKEPFFLLFCSQLPWCDSMEFTGTPKRSIIRFKLESFQLVHLSSSMVWHQVVCWHERTIWQKGISASFQETLIQAWYLCIFLLNRPLFKIDRFEKIWGCLWQGRGPPKSPSGC